MASVQGDVTLSSLHIVESVDGADLRRYLAQSKIGVVETQREVRVQNSANEAVSVPAVAIENVEQSTTARSENSQPLQVNLPVFENSEDRNTTLDLNETENDEVEASDSGFVRYLSDKASYAIQGDDPVAAQPYINRLLEIKGTRKVVAELKHQAYSRLVAQEFEKLRQGDVESPSRVVREVFAPGGEALDPYRIELEDGIVDYFLRQAEEKLSKTQYDEALESIRIITLRTGENTWETRIKACSDFLERLGSEMVAHASNLIHQHYFKDAIDILYTLYTTPSLFRFVKPVGEEYAHEYLRLAVTIGHIKAGISGDPPRLDNEQLEGTWMYLGQAHLMISILSPKTSDSQLSTSITKADFHAFLNGVPDLQYLNWCYEVDDGLSTKLLKFRSSQLAKLTSRLEESIWNHLIQEEWESAFVKLLSLRTLQKAPERPPKDKKMLVERPPRRKKMLAEWSTIELFTNVRLRNWSPMHGKMVQEVELQVPHLCAEYLYLYHLTRAELAYFYLRDLGAALNHCQLAMKIDAVPSFLKTRSDVFYLLGRIFTRKGLPLDADYYFSLISGDTYNQWSIYGSPGMLLRQLGVKMSNGRLIGLNHAKLHEIMKTTFEVSGEPKKPNIDNASDDRLRTKNKYYADNTTAIKLTKALFADDVDWVAELNNLGIQISSGSFKNFLLHGTFIHFASVVESPDLLQICLRNPWVPVNQKNAEGKTALHFAAKAVADEQIKMLLVGGADLEAADVNGNTPLHDMLDMLPGACLQNTRVPDAVRIMLDARARSKADYPGRTTLGPRNLRSETPLHCLRYSLEKHLGTFASVGEPILHLEKFADAYRAIVEHWDYSYTDAVAADGSHCLAIDSNSYALLFIRLGQDPPPHGSPAERPVAQWPLTNFGGASVQVKSSSKEPSVKRKSIVSDRSSSSGSLKSDAKTSKGKSKGRLFGRFGIF